MEAGETPEALVGLGTALWWLEDIGASLRASARTRRSAAGPTRCRPRPSPSAVGRLRREPRQPHDGPRLARAAGADRRGPRPRAARGLGALRPCRAGRRQRRPARAEAYAREAREQARATGDSDLELSAVGQIGGALVLMGRVAEGTAMLDESDGGRAGREGGPDTVVQTATIVCLSRASELKRAAQWIRAAEDFNRRLGSTRLYAVCRTHHAGSCSRWAAGPRPSRSSRPRCGRRPRASRSCAPRRWRGSPSCGSRRDASGRRPRRAHEARARGARAAG